MSPSRSPIGCKHLVTCGHILDLLSSNTVIQVTAMTVNI